MRFASRWALASIAALPLAGIVFLLGRWVGDRMAAAGQGWEMAFYWSPLVFCAVDAVLGLGSAIGLVGAVVSPGCLRRAQSVAAVAICVAILTLLPWR